VANPFSLKLSTNNFDFSKKSKRNVLTNCTLDKVLSGAGGGLYMCFKKANGMHLYTVP